MALCFLAPWPHIAVAGPGQGCQQALCSRAPRLGVWWKASLRPATSPGPAPRGLPAPAAPQVEAARGEGPFFRRRITSLGGEGRGSRRGFGSERQCHAGGHVPASQGPGLAPAGLAPALCLEAAFASAGLWVQVLPGVDVGVNSEREGSVTETQGSARRHCGTRSNPVQSCSCPAPGNSSKQALRAQLTQTPRAL